MSPPRRLLAFPVALLLAGGVLAGCASHAATAPTGDLGTDGGSTHGGAG